MADSLRSKDSAGATSSEGEGLTRREKAHTKKELEELIVDLQETRETREKEMERSRMEEDYRKRMEEELRKRIEKERKHQEKERKEFAKILEEKDATIIGLETEVAGLQSRLYEYEAKQAKLLKEVTEIKRQAKRNQEEIEESMEKMKEEETVRREQMKQELATEAEVRQSQMERMFQIKMEEVLRAVMPTQQTGGTTSTPIQGVLPKNPKRPRNDHRNVSSSESEGEENVNQREERQKEKTKNEKVHKLLLQKREEENVNKNKNKNKNKNNDKQNETKERRKHISLDSLETSTESNTESTTETDESGPTQIHKSIVIREVAKVPPYDVYGTKDLKDFWMEYETYCKSQWPENRRIWSEKLGENLTGRIADFYKNITCAGEVKYEVVKERIQEQVNRIKGGIKYRKKNDFQNARMGKQERIDHFAHRLETLARKRFGDDRINENKDLFKKFLECIPDDLRDYINTKRKEKSRWAGRRLLWNDVLELLEDYQWDRGEIEEGWGRIRHGKKEYATYREALIDAPPHLNPQYKNSQRPSYAAATNSQQQQPRQEYRPQQQPQTGYQQPAAPKPQRGPRPQYQQSQGQQNNYQGNWQNQNNNRSQSRGRRGYIMQCLRCKRLGHTLANCYLTKGACFGCGLTGHMVATCPQGGNICNTCQQHGHWSRNCPNRPTRCGNNRPGCGNCGEIGHFARNCPHPLNHCSVCNTNGHRTATCRSRVNQNAQIPQVVVTAPAAAQSNNAVTGNGV